MSKNDIISIQPKIIYVTKSHDNFNKDYCMNNLYDHIGSPYCITQYCAKPII